MRLTGVTSIPSPVTGLRAGMQVDPPAGDATSESKPTRAVNNTPPVHSRRRREATRKPEPFHHHHHPHAP